MQCGEDAVGAKTRSDSPEFHECNTDAIRLQKLLRRMILRSFPRLRRREFSIGWGAEGDLLAYSIEGEHHHIAVNRCLRGAPTPVLMGGIAHELVHADNDLRLGPYPRELAWKRYLTSRWCRMKEERATDTRVIELGYGPHLLAFVRYGHKLRMSFQREHGLLYREIKEGGL